MTDADVFPVRRTFKRKNNVQTQKKARKVSKAKKWASWMWMTDIETSPAARIATRLPNADLPNMAIPRIVPRSAKTERDLAMTLKS